MDVKEYIKEMPKWFKILVIGLVTIGIILLITSAIVSGTAPNDHGRGDIVHAEVGNCINGIGFCCLIVDVLFIIAYMCANSPQYGWFLAIIKWFLIVSGFISLILSIVIGVVIAKERIGEYDRLYPSQTNVTEIFCAEDKIVI